MSAADNTNSNGAVRTFSEAQRRAIEAAGNTFVSASAGSGKTTVMIERVLSALKGGTSIADTAVLTFTKAAAADMRDKLYSRLLSEDFPGAKEQIRLLPVSDIDTIHAFCQKLAKKYFYYAGADPAFEIADEATAALMLSSCAARAVEEGAGEIFSRLYEAFLRRRSDKPLRQTVERVYRFAYMRPDPEEWIRSALSKCADGDFIRSALIKELKRSRDDVLRLAQGHKIKCADAGYCRNLPATDCIIENLRRFPERGQPPAFPKGRIPEEFSALNDDFLKLKEEYLRLYEELDEIDFLTPSELSAPFSRELLSLAEKTAALYAAEKNRAGLADYQDLEHMALRVLASEAGQEISSKYKLVFVDEYQDVNPIQEEIIRALTKGGGTLFAVGDVKQSIYAFRGCEPKIFAERLKACARGEGTAVELNRNFRGGKNILSFVNAVMSPLMTEKFGSVDYASSAMLEPREDAPLGEVSFTLISRPKEAGPAGGVYSVKSHAEAEDGEDDAEAEEIVKTVKRLLGSTVTENGAARPAREEDVAVLVRSSGRLINSVALKLKAEGITPAVKSALYYESCPATAALISYLRLIDNRRDDVSLAGALLSPLSGFTEEELCEIRLSALSRDAAFYEAAENFAQEGALKEKINCFYQKLDCYERLSGAVETAELAGRIVSDSEYFESVYAAPDGAENAAALSSFLNLLSTKRYSGPVCNFVRSLSENPPSSENPSLGSNGVKIMTVHASKGLEFPFVIFAGLSRKFNLRDMYDRVLLSGELGLCAKYFDTENRCVSDTGLWKLCSLEIRRRQLEEELRVLYVALTRAKEKLCLIATGNRRENAEEEPNPEKASCFLDWLYPAAEKFSPQAEGGDKPKAKEIISDRSEKAISLLGGEQAFEKEQDAEKETREKRAVKNKTEGEYIKRQKRCSETEKRQSAERQAGINETAENGAEENEVAAASDHLGIIRLVSPGHRLRQRSEPAPAPASDPVLVEEIKRRIAFRPDVSSLPVKTNVTKEAEKLSDFDTDEPFVPVVFGGGEDAAQKGTAYHLFMEKLDFYAPFEKEYRRLEAEYPESASLVKKDDIRAAGEIMARLCEGDGKKVYRELPFVMDMGDGGAVSLIQGVIDALIVNPDGSAAVVDYKTTRAENLFTPEYRYQTEVYALAAERLLGLRVGEKYIYSFRLNRLIPLKREELSCFTALA